jgi:hypothetical protein
MNQLKSVELNAQAEQQYREYLEEARYSDEFYEEYLPVRPVEESGDLAGEWDYLKNFNKTGKSI